VPGSFRVDRGGCQLGLGPRLQRALLAMLVVDAGHVVPADRLTGVLWRAEPPAAPLASVQACVSELRRLLEPGRQARAPARILVTQAPGYALRACQRRRTVLAAGPGPEPGPEPRRLEAAVLAQDASLDWRPAVAAPSDAPGPAGAQVTRSRPAGKRPGCRR